MHIDPSWVSRLLEASRQLGVTAHVAHAMPGHAALLAAVARMFSRFTAQELPRVRAWVDGGQRYTITDALVNLAGRPELTLPERLAKASDSPQYCVTFNGLSAWCDAFAQDMQAHMLAPLFAGLGGPPTCGVDFYAFLGNYGYTPFGVHDDTDHSLLWHLGPGAKTAYVWPRASYVELTHGTLSTPDFAALLPHAQRHELQPGDLLFIPMGDFHLLETREFSGTLGLTLFPDDPLLECTEALRLLAPDVQALRRLAETPITLDQLAAVRRCAVQSNGHVITPPQLSAVRVSAPDLAVLRKCTLRSRPGWPLRTAHAGGRQALFVRRRVIWGRPNPLFDLLCENLADGGELPFARLEHLAAGQFQTAAVAELVRHVAALGGVVIAPH